MEVLKNLGKIVKEGRLNKKMSQDELGKKIGVTRYTISSWESGSSGPTFTQFLDLIDTLDLDIVDTFEKSTGKPVASKELDKKVDQIERNVEKKLIDKINEIFKSNSHQIVAMS